MANSGWTADPADITIPPDAGPNDPRVYVGPNDPLAKFLGQDAAVVWYWAANRAFVISVENSGGDGDHGQMHIWSTDEIHGIKQMIDMDHEVTANQGNITLAQGSDSQHVTTSILGETVRIDGNLGVTIEANTGVPIRIKNDANFDLGVDIDGDLTFGTLPGIGPVVGEGSSGLDFAGIGLAETETLLTDDPVVFEANSCYRVDVVGGYQGTNLNNDPVWRVRKSNGAASGQLACFFGRTPVTTINRTFNLSMTQYFTTGAVVPASVKLCVTTAAITAGTAVFAGSFGGRDITVRKVGPSSMRPNANVLT